MLKLLGPHISLDGARVLTAAGKLVTFSAPEHVGVDQRSDAGELAGTGDYVVDSARLARSPESPWDAD